MKFKVKKLNESNGETLYQDSSTGKLYRIENGEFVEVKLNGRKNGGDGDGIRTPYPLPKDDTEDPIEVSPPVDTDDDDYDDDPLGSKKMSPRQEVEGLLREIDVLKERINDIDGSYDEDINGENNVNDISDEILDSTEELSKEIEKLKKELDKLRKELKDKGGILPSDMEEIEQKKKDIENIKDAFKDVDVADKIMKETQKKVFSSRQQKLAGERAAKRAQQTAAASDADVINMLKSSLSRTLKAEVKTWEEYSWAKFNKKAQAAGLLAPGRKRQEKVEIPSLNVYFDRSGSWDSDKSIFGQNAVDSIAYLAKKGLLKMKIYYFNDNLMNEDPKFGRGGTNPKPVFQHIQDTKPDNVLIMTDADFDYQGIGSCPDIRVPGAVWILFKEQMSEELPKKLTGKKMTKTFFIK